MSNRQSTIALVLCLVASVATGCVVDETSMLIVGNGVPDEGEATCTITAERDGTFNGSGVLDVQFAREYSMFPVVVNQLSNSSAVAITPGSKDGLESGLIEGNSIALTGFEFSYEAPPNSLILPENVFVPVGVTIDAGEGIAALAVPALSAAVVSTMAQSAIFDAPNAIVTILITVKAKGVTTSGTEVESLEFTLPVEVCSGCLVKYTALAPDSAGVPTCDPLVVPPTDDDRVTAKCFVGQDNFGIDCRDCWDLLGSSEICDP